MKREEYLSYEVPTVDVIEVNVEKGFQVSGAGGEGGNWVNG